MARRDVLHFSQSERKLLSQNLFYELVDQGWQLYTSFSAQLL